MTLFTSQEGEPSCIASSNVPPLIASTVTVTCFLLNSKSCIISAVFLVLFSANKLRSAPLIVKSGTVFCKYAAIIDLNCNNVITS
jgi:hypothetical protein